MDNALVQLCTSGTVPDKFCGPDRRNERNNLLRQRKHYCVTDGKLYFNKIINVFPVKSVINFFSQNKKMKLQKFRFG
jgi:hypothetical protein